MSSMTINSKDRQLQHLTSEVSYRSRLQEICNKINAAANLDEILINLKDDITSLFEAERITVYSVSVWLALLAAWVLWSRPARPQSA